MRFREPLLLPFVAVAAGVATAAAVAPLHTGLTVRDVVLAGAALAALALFASAVRSRLMPLAAALGALYFGGIALMVARPTPEPRALSVPDNTPALFEGCVTDPALVAADREKFTADLATGARAQVALYARPDEEFPALPYGSRVEFEGKARRTHNYNNPGSFDAVHFYARQSIFWNISGDAAKVRRLPGQCGNAAAGFIFAIRSAALDRLDRLYADDAYANGMMQAVLIGVTAKLDRMWTDDYRSTGTFHALVISGSHVAVLAAVLLFFLRICLVPRGAAIVLTVLVAWLYAGITGWQAPVLRSAAGMTLYAIGRCFYRDGRLLNILAAVALVFVVADPEQLFDASFQLSFLAVAVIGIFVVPALDATSAPLSRGLEDLAATARDIRLPPRTAQFRIELRLLARTLTLCAGLSPRAAGFIVATFARVTLYLWEIFVTSFFIQIGLALPMAIYFHRLSASGLSANAVIVPVLSAVVPLGFLAIGANSATLAHLCAWLLSLARMAVGFHARLEPDWRIPSPPVWLAAAFAAALVWAGLRLIKSAVVRGAAWSAVAALLTVIVLHPFAPELETGRFELNAIDVGQGDSLLAAFPDGRTMLIDAGGIPVFRSAARPEAKTPNLDIGEQVVSPYLWSRSIRHLDVVAMTHAHADHMGGMAAVLRNFHPKELWTGATPESPEWTEVRTAAQQLHIAIRPMRRGPAFPFGGALVEVLAPSPDYLPEHAPKNNDSLVMRIRFGQTSFLLTGDMERQIENDLAAEGLLAHDDVLKVGHHGSRTSSTAGLLDAEHPAFGIISAGFDNSYGHPHPATVAALAERHATVLRTDEEGLIRLTSDGRRLTLANQAK